MSLTPEYFRGVYAANKDPWGFTTSPYEAAKYQTTLAALPRLRYRRAWEIGCSIGVLTCLLAERCDHLLATDVADEALAQATRRTADQPQVDVKHLALPDQEPEGTFDLIVLSEVGYYFDREDLGRIKQMLLNRLERDAHLLLVHWTPFVPDYPLSGDQVHEFFRGSQGLRHLQGERHERYRLDLWMRD